MDIFLSSPDFSHGRHIPKKFAKCGFNWSPHLEWSAPPEGTRNLVLICECPDSPGGECVHWIVYGLLPQTSHLPRALQTSEKLPSGAMQGKNDLGGTGYDGPDPPPFRQQRYLFKLFALSTVPPLSPGADKVTVRGEIRNTVIGSGELMGYFMHCPKNP